MITRAFISQRFGLEETLEGVMVDFLCQLHLVTGYPDTWSNIILSVSVRVVLDRINI